MGWVVNGYCHASTATALKAMRADVGGFNSFASYGGALSPSRLMSYPVQIDSGGLVKYEYWMEDSTNVYSDGHVFYYQLPTCASGEEEDFMPWASGGGGEPSTLGADFLGIGLLAFAAFAGFAKGGQR